MSCQKVTLYLNNNELKADDHVIAEAPAGLTVWLQAIKHERMNRASRPCEESEDYSLADCINQGMARQVGCQSFWSNFSRIPFCRDWGSLKKYIRAYDDLMYLHETFDKHGCLEPCTFIHYQVKKFVETFKRKIDKVVRGGHKYQKYLLVEWKWPPIDW